MIRTYNRALASSGSREGEKAVGKGDLKGGEGKQQSYEYYRATMTADSRPRVTSESREGEGTSSAPKGPG